MRTKFIIAFLIVIAAVIIFYQFQMQDRLRLENQLLAQQILKLKLQNESLSNRLAAVADAKSLSDEQMNELLKLRGEIGVLRQQTKLIENLHEENRQFRSQIQAAQNSQYQLLTAEDKYTLNHQHAIVAITRLESAMYSYAEAHGGWFPANFDQLDTSGYLDSVTNLPGNFKLDDFEFVNAGLVNNNMSDKLILRQKNPYQTSYGKWVREYGYSSGGVVSQYSDNGNFDDYERQHMVASPPNPNQ